MIGGWTEKRISLNTSSKTLKERRQIVINAQNEKQWKITEEKIRKNSSHIFKMLRKTGNRANRKSERPYIVE